MEGRTFSSREVLISTVREHYRSFGLELKIGKHSDKKKLILQCPSGGKYHSASGQTLKRERATKKSDCPFAIRASFSPVSNNWHIHTVCETHNHERSQGYAENRKLSDAEKNLYPLLTNRVHLLYPYLLKIDRLLLSNEDLNQ